MRPGHLGAMKHRAGQSKAMKPRFTMKCVWALLITMCSIYAVKLFAPQLLAELRQRGRGPLHMPSSGVSYVVRELVSKVNQLEEQLSSQQEMLDKVYGGSLQNKADLEKEIGQLKDLKDATARLIDDERRSTTALVQEHAKGTLDTVRALEHAQTLLEYRRKQEFRSNSQQSHRLLTSGDPQHWVQRTFQHYNAYGFIKYSAYRVSPQKVAVVALAALRLRNYRRLGNCLWRDNVGGEAVNGTLSILYMGDHHSTEYEVAVLHCVLETPMGSSGGFLEGTIDEEKVVLYREDKLPSVGPDKQEEHKTAYCSPVVRGKAHPGRVRQWLDYSRVVFNPGHYYLYDMGGALSSQDVKGATKEYAELMTVTSMTDGADYDVWHNADGVALNDCLYRSLHVAKWVFVHEMSDYLEVLPPHSVKSLLNRHSDKAWMTHQAMRWDMERCNSKAWDALWGPERMVFADPNPLCIDNPGFADLNLCLGTHGLRRFIFQPRKVELLGLHSVVVPPKSGEDLHRLTEARHHHYAEFVTLEAGQLCNKTIDDWEKVDWWQRDTSFAKVVQTAKKCTFSQTACAAELPE